MIIVLDTFTREYVLDIFKKPVSEKGMPWYLTDIGLLLEDSDEGKKVLILYPNDSLKTYLDNQFKNSDELIRFYECDDRRLFLRSKEDINAFVSVLKDFNVTDYESQLHTLTHMPEERHPMQQGICKIMSGGPVEICSRGKTINVFSGR